MKSGFTLYPRSALNAKELKCLISCSSDGPYWRLTRSRTLGVQGIMIDGSNKVLLVRHSYVRGSHLPGGGVERDENLEQALRRELLEESGIELTRKPCLHGIFSNFERSAGDHIAVYVVRDWTGVCALSPDLKLSKTGSLSCNHYQMD